MITAEATAKLELCFITRQKWPRKRSLHSVNEHFEAIFNAVRERKVSFAYSSAGKNYYLVIFHCCKPIDVRDLLSATTRWKRDVSKAPVFLFRRRDPIVRCPPNPVSFSPSSCPREPNTGGRPRHGGQRPIAFFNSLVSVNAICSERGRCIASVKRRALAEERIRYAVSTREA